MAKTILIWLLATVLLATVSIAQAQQPKKIPRIGYLTLGSSSPRSANEEAFRDGLHHLGYIEGQNVHVEYRYAAGGVLLLPEPAVEFVSRNPHAVLGANPQSK